MRGESLYYGKRKNGIEMGRFRFSGLEKGNTYRKMFCSGIGQTVFIKGTGDPEEREERLKFKELSPRTCNLQWLRTQKKGAKARSKEKLRKELREGSVIGLSAKAYRIQRDG